MAIEILEIIEIIILIVVILILYTVNDTIRRTKGRFTLGSKAMFIAFSVFFVVEVLAHFSILRNLVEDFELLDELLSAVFISVMLVTIIIINKKVREVHDGHKKLKYRAKKKK